MLIYICHITDFNDKKPSISHLRRRVYVKILITMMLELKCILPHSNMWFPAANLSLLMGAITINIMIYLHICCGIKHWECIEASVSSAGGNLKGTSVAKVLFTHGFFFWATLLNLWVFRLNVIKKYSKQYVVYLLRPTVKHTTFTVNAAHNSCSYLKWPPYAWINFLTHVTWERVNLRNTVALSMLLASLRIGLRSLLFFTLCVYTLACM
jgi:hypothetical protein